MARLRTRHIAFCAVLVLFIFFFLPANHTIAYLPQSSYGSSSRTGTHALARYMNDPVYVPDIRAKNSSFDWSSVRIAHPPPLTPVLPPPVAHRPRIQYRFKPDRADVAVIQEQRRLEVKRVFQKSWASYRAKAWMKDALKPISGQYVDQFSGWAATLVDSLDTLWMMGMREEFYEAVEAVASIDFGKSTAATVNTFETCIRYLGGLLAAYDLSGHEVLLKKAIEVGDLLYAGFNTENGMPVDFINFESAKEGSGLRVESQVVSASPGTITLEFSRLSQLTGDNKYYAAVSQVMELFYQNQNATRLPGMWPMMVSMSQKDVVSGYQFTIGGNADSLYEYLPKAHALLGSTDPSSAKYEAMSRYFMDTARDNLFFRPMIPGGEDILISGNCDVLDGGARLDPESEHLSCFIGGLYALGGRLFSSDEYLDIGAKLARGCAYAYRSFPTGIMPERYNMALCPGKNHRADCAWDEAAFAEEAANRPQYKSDLPKGFTTAKDPRYILRPEAIESIFILWRITGDASFRETAWDMFEAVANATDTQYANAAIMDVNIVGGGVKEDYMESFWMAETLKYFYLCFADTDLISLDDFVLNTEAHPFRLSKG
ncbi:Mannosyl-oligosaccharide 1,2-alpha-mannosidase [Ascochyta rabiei]|uniref:alpha-1,2-Mannosidase n=1 Tax=Didymella rabiei TaxID=5454 RepID=A0A163D0R1_DIDRA|nr:Mannosyl-oligosaccharide 1,2-alpha-mannosidase [Ascochyta rabiei]KZM22829.1 calcium ion binding [Ascochyta rabiei]UPX10941.1 Mannosyl-oligosaccharide 1,2-alpha-mannosidase [Ascochyta rabiei]